MSIFRRQKVPFTNNTLARCICSKCPVQTQSACAIGKNQKLADMNKMIDSKGEPDEPMGGEMMMQANPPEKQKSAMPKPEEVAETYCSIGTASCTDLNMNKACICPDCEIYREYSLSASKPVEHYCFNGRAQ